MEYEAYNKNKSETMEFLQKQLASCLEKIEEDNLIHLSNAFIQHCIYPRLLFSAADALYAISFLKVLINLRVPNFNILHILGNILKGILPCVHCCTEKESDNLGIFFMELFQLINHWTKPEIWENECKGYSGFSKMLWST